jgi:hypothetical protein
MILPKEASDHDLFYLWPPVYQRSQIPATIPGLLIEIGSFKLFAWAALES